MTSVYLLRFIILAEFYDLFMNYAEKIKLDDIVVSLVNKAPPHSETTIRKNIVYLTNSEYLNFEKVGNKKHLGITYKGIKLIEVITNGELDFKIPDEDSEDGKKLLDEIKYQFYAYDPSAYPTVPP